jgi:hypothetical protein
MESEGNERYGMESEGNVRQVKTWKFKEFHGKESHGMTSETNARYGMERKGME